ncbi:asparagine synthase (glutamine-hydrolyzing) [Flavobacterium sp.]|uniref:asparagine synthase (glutamine-hydrolyzing) n=1 Tax=Flavobacterium sp. TaxID=239 RepID=UPI003D0B8F10
MCGILGSWSRKKNFNIEKEHLNNMLLAIEHRGPDGKNVLIDGFLGFGFCRLSIVDLENGMQPFISDDNNYMLICNGEIFNYKELKKELEKEGVVFKTNCDVEVLLHLYIKHEINMLDLLNGQFAFALFDKKKQKLILGRDQFGICPLFFTVVDDNIIFGSEVKAIIKHPLVEKKIDIKGLEHVFSFPGLIGDQTMFAGINSLKAGHFLEVTKNEIREKEYWDLVYPNDISQVLVINENEAKEELDRLLTESVKLRLSGDVPIGVYLSGGIDSSIIAGLMSKHASERVTSLSMGFSGYNNREIDERKYQRIMAKSINSIHHELDFGWDSMYDRLRSVIYHSESPLKEIYNICSMQLSNHAKNNNLKSVLCGEGADEIFGGYHGYKFDQFTSFKAASSIEDLLDEEIRERMWGTRDLVYEKNHFEFIETKKNLYADTILEKFDSNLGEKNIFVDHSKMIGRSKFDQRSYLDFKLRLGGHLITDHGDRMGYANSIEARYPFLDKKLIDFVRLLPSNYKLKNGEEKYLLKEIAKKYVPNDIIQRQKFGFVAPGSSDLLKSNVEWVNDILSYNTIKRQGYFNPDSIEQLKKKYSSNNFQLNIPYDSDLLMIVITFGIFLNEFELN